MIKKLLEAIEFEEYQATFGSICMRMVVMIENATWEADTKQQAQVTATINCKQVPKEIWLKWGWFKFARRIQLKFFCLLIKALLHIPQPPLATSHVYLYKLSSPTWMKTPCLPDRTGVLLPPDISFPFPIWNALSCWPSCCIQILTILLTKVNSTLSYNLLRPL